MPDPDPRAAVEAARRAQQQRQDEEEARAFFGDRPTVQFAPVTQEQRTQAELENIRGMELQVRAQQAAERAKKQAERQAKEEGFISALAGPKPSPELKAAREKLYMEALTNLRKKVDSKLRAPYEALVPERFKQVSEKSPIGHSSETDSRNVRQPTEVKRERKMETFERNREPSNFVRTRDPKEFKREK